MLMALPDTPSPFTVIPAIQYGEADGMPLLLDMLRPPAEPSILRPAVLYLHGGAWEFGERTIGLYPWLSPLLAAHGFVSVNITYRLSGQAIFPAQIYDAKAAVRWLRAHASLYHIDSERIGVWGDSAGGHLAALLGVTGDLSGLEGNSGSSGHSSQVQAVVARVAPSDFLLPGGQLLNDGDTPVTRLFGGTVHEREALMRLASPVYHVRAGAPPFLLVHGTRDETVPFEQAEQLYAALLAVGVEVTLQPVPEAYHNLLATNPDLPWMDKPWDTLGWQALTFFRRHLCQ